LESERANFYRKIDEEIENTIRGISATTLLREVRFDGASSKWRLDRVLAARHLLSDEDDYSMDLAIIEIKHIEPTSGKGRYHQHMSYAYVELNDLRLGYKSEAEAGSDVPRFCLIVNRYPVTGESKRDYGRIFQTIGVKMINFNDDAEKASFLEEIRRLCQQWGFDEQSRRLEEALKTLDKTAK